MHIFLLRENRAKITDYIWSQGFVVEQNRSVLKQLRSFTALIFDGNLFQRLWADAVNDLNNLLCLATSIQLRLEKKPYHYFFC